MRSGVSRNRRQRPRADGATNTPTDGPPAPGRTTLTGPTGLVARFDEQAREREADRLEREAARQRDLRARRELPFHRSDDDPSYHPDDPDAERRLGTGGTSERGTYRTGVGRSERVDDTQVRVQTADGVRDLRWRDVTATDRLRMTQERTREESNRVEQTDVRAVACAARTALEELRDAARDEDDAAEVTRLEAELRALEGTPDLAAVVAVVNRNQLIVDDAVRAVGTRTTQRDRAAYDGVSTTRTAEETRADGTGTSRTDSTGVEADWAEGRLAANESTSRTTTAADGGTRTTTSSSQHSIDAGGGRVQLGRTASTGDQTANAAGDVTAGTSTRTETTASLIHGDDGTGAGIGRSQETTARGEHAELVGRVSADGSFVVDVERVEGSSPAQWTVTMRVSTTVGARLTARRPQEAENATAGCGERDGAEAPAEARVTASAHLGGSATGVLTYRHVLGEAEARRYLGNVERADAGEPGGGEPEFGTIARLRAARAHGADAAAAARAALGDPDAVASLAEGESVELETSATVDGGADLGASYGQLGAGVSVAGSTTWTQRVGLAHPSDPEGRGRELVDLTLTLSRARSGSLGATATAYGAGMGITESRGDTETLSITFRLDRGAPEYAALHRRIIAIHTDEALRAAAASPDLSPLVHRRTDGSGESSGREVVANAGPVGFSVTGRSARSEEETRDDYGRERFRAEGTNEVGAAAQIADVDVLQQTERDRARATVGPGGDLVVDLDHEVESTDEDNLADGARAVRDWASGVLGGERDVGEEAVDLAANTPRQRLEDQLEETETDVTTDELDADAVRTLIARARDDRRWRACCLLPDRDALRDWVGLRGLLLSTTASNRDRARGIAGFTAEHGGEPLRAALHQWRDAEHAEVGRELEWPDALSSQRTRYLAIRDAVRDADGQLATMMRHPQGATRMAAWRDQKVRGLAAIREAVERCTEMRSLGGKAQLVDACFELSRTAEEAYRRAAQAFTPEVPAGTVEAAAETAEAEVDPRQRRIAEMIAVLFRFKASEREVFRRAYAALDSWTQSDASVVSEMNRLEDSIDAWIAKVLELRELYRATETPEAAWCVSVGPYRPRNVTTEPDVVTRISLHNQAGAYATPYGQWQRQAMSY
jgi:hypothetical protein